MGLPWGALGSQLVRRGVSQLPGTTPSELPCPSRWCLRSPVVHTHHLTDEAMHDIPERDESSPQSHDEQDPSPPSPEDLSSAPFPKEWPESHWWHWVTLGGRGWTVLMLHTLMSVEKNI